MSKLALSIIKDNTDDDVKIDYAHLVSNMMGVQDDVKILHTFSPLKLMNYSTDANLRECIEKCWKAYTEGLKHSK